MDIYDSFDDYLSCKIQDIQLVNVNDICMAIAISWAYEGEIPENICNKKQIELIENAIESNGNSETDEYTIAALKPVHDWILKIICKAIQEREIKPLVLSVSIHGKVDPIGTYVHYDKIDQWFAYRGINGSMFNESFDFRDYCKYLDRVLECIEDNSHLLSDKINARKVLDSEGTEIYLSGYSSLSENYHLRERIEQLEQELNKNTTTVGKGTERFAKFREQILGAALNVLAKWPELCANSSGKIEATKVAELIDEKSLLFWPDTGQPPLSRDKMEREISKWINKTGK